MKKILFYTKRIQAAHGNQKAAAFLFVSLLNAELFGEWIRFVESVPEPFPDTWRVQMIMRPAARFMRRWLSVAERRDILSSHYKALANRLSSDNVQKMQTKYGVTLAEMTGKGGAKYPVYMDADISKDGCIRFTLVDPATSLRLASITGALGMDAEKNRVFWLGAMQGATPETGKEDVKNATRDLNGLRPKQAVLHAVAAFCLWFGAHRIIAPSLQNQIAIKNFKKGQNIQTDYDNFWQDVLGSETDARGDYILPLPLPRRKVEEVQQKRRKDWTLRYGRIDAMSAEINTKLASL